MPEINESTFENYSDVVSQIAEELVQEILQMQADYAKQVADNPQRAQQLRREISDKYEQLAKAYVISSTDQMREVMPKAYLRGIQQANGEAKLLKAGDPTNDITVSQKKLWRGYEQFAGNIRPPSETAIKLLEKYPRHLTLYQVFEAAAEGQIQQTRTPIIRSAGDALQSIAIESGTQQYKEANTFTRRQMSQDILNRFADRGITGRIDTGGRRWRLDSYAEMVARTQTGNAARQAHMNRQQQFGMDLVRISSHSPCSDLCFPWQGRVYSLSGESNQYPPLDEAIDGGLFHPNCKHSQSAYTPGVSEKLENEGEFADSKTKNKEAAKIEQTQRYNERQIKHWKRREAVAITEDAQKKAKRKISAYQKRNRELVKEHDYLRRKYDREQL